MMPTAQGISPMVPSHVLRVGQTVRLDPPQETEPGQSLTKSGHEEADLEISLENLNQLILELDPSFELIQNNDGFLSPPTDKQEVESSCRLIPRGSPSLPIAIGSKSPSIPIPTPTSLSCSPQGALVFSSSPTSALPPLPCGSAPRRTPSARNGTTPGSLRLSHSNRNSAISLLSTSTCSDTSYILGSTLSLTGDDSDSLDSVPSSNPTAFTDDSRMRFSPEKPPLTRRGPQNQDLCLQGTQNGPASLCSSMNDIPVLLVNGTPQPDLNVQLSRPQMDLIQNFPVSTSKPPCSGFMGRFSGREPSMKFVMDTSKFWFRPHITRAEAETLIRDGPSGSFVVRDSTSFRGSFGLVMKVEPTLTSAAANPESEQREADVIRHFLIESSPKGVRVKGAKQEPYFGSLSALVYQHTISAYALPCRLLLQAQASSEERTNQKAASEDNVKTACNFVYLNAVSTEMLTGPCAVQRAVTSTLSKVDVTATIVNLKASPKGVTLTDINRKLFFRRHYPAHLLSFSGKDPECRLWTKGCSFSARMFGFVAKGVQPGVENVCHVFAEYDPLQPCDEVIQAIGGAVAKP